MSGPARTLTEIQVADILKMHERKCSIAEIADAYGVNHMTIRRAIEPGYNGVSIPTDRFPELRKMYDDGETLVAMAARFNTSQTTVRKAILKLGLDPIRKRDDEMRGDRPKVRNGHLVGNRDNWKARISDAPDTDMGRLIHEGPSPERRALMAEGRI